MQVVFCLPDVIQLYIKSSEILTAQHHYLSFLEGHKIYLTNFLVRIWVSRALIQASND